MSLWRDLNRRELVQLPLSLALPGAAPARAGTATPQTYVIEYGFNYVNNPAFLRQVAEAPPHFLHVGHDVPFKSGSGPRLVPEPFGGKYQDRYGLLSPEALRRYSDDLREFVSQLHRAGTRIVIPYICNQTMGGDWERRAGFWEFYDHWDDYRAFGLPPKPAADPLEWLQRDPQGRISFNYPKTHPSFAPFFRWAPCPNNPHWTRYLEFVVAKIAECGYDGVFVDNNILHCYCRWCRHEFARYLASRYRPEALRRAFGATEAAAVEMSWQADRVSWARVQPEFREFLLEQKSAELKERFGVTKLETVQEINYLGNGYLKRPSGEFLAYLEAKYPPAEHRRRFGLEDLRRLGLETPQERLAWFETQRFWAWSIAENLIRLRQAGERVKKGFLVLPNWGAMRTILNVDGRRQDAKNVEEWSRGCLYMMFEEDGLPGRLARGVYHDFLSQYKYGLAAGVRPVVLPYGKQTPAILELAHAEAAASGGGAFVQGGYRFPEVRRRWRSFYEKYPSLFEGYEPYAEVALALMFNQVHYENATHLLELHLLKRALDAGHVLFNYLTADHVVASRFGNYRVVLLPQTAYMSDAVAAGLENWVRRGGRLLLTGDLPAFDETCRSRARPVFSQALRGGSQVQVVPYGKGQLAWAPDVRQVAPIPEEERKLLYLSSTALNEAVEKLSVEQPILERPLLPLLDRLAGTPLAYTDGANLPGLRATCYWWRETAGGRLILHLLNYDPEPARNVAILLPLPQALGGLKLAQLRGYRAGRELPFELGGEIRGGRLNFRVPEVTVHVAVEAVLAASSVALGGTHRSRGPASAGLPPGKGGYILEPSETARRELALTSPQPSFVGVRGATPSMTVHGGNIP